MVFRGEEENQKGEAEETRRTFSQSRDAWAALHTSQGLLVVESLTLF